MLALFDFFTDAAREENLIWWRLATAFVFVISLMANFVMVMDAPSLECCKCHGWFRPGYMVRLFTSSDPRHGGRVMCRRCRNEILYPGGTRDGRWYARFLKSVRRHG